jgi:FkbM family methyltransferase
MDWSLSLVPGFRTPIRKLSSARRIFREEGIASLITAVSRHIDLFIRLFAARAKESVILDGCVFDLKEVPKAPMKLVLIRGEYEDFERRAVRQYLDPEQPVIELGGCIGVVACISNRLLQIRGSHVVVEANPDVIPMLEENRRRNRCDFEIINAAITYGQDSVTFSPAIDLWANSLQKENRGTTAPVTVTATSLGAIANERNFGSFTLICDIEGYEYELVQNEPEVLQRVDTLILETHPQVIGEAKTAQLLDNLNKIGLRVLQREALVVVMKRLPA